MKEEKNYKTRVFPKSRIATIDVCAIGLKKHHVAALIEVDVTGSRNKVKERKKKKETVSFYAWLIKAISVSMKDHDGVAAYLKSKRSIMVFNDINVSIVVEKVMNDTKVPIPLIIHKANERTIEDITLQIHEAKEQILGDKDIVLLNKPKQTEQIYYLLPGFVRRMFWRYVIMHPEFAFRKMGNVAITSVGGLGRVNAWFIPISVHPVCFGIGDIIKKPVVIDDKIEIREMLNMSVLLDHDVVDGMEMARFIKKLVRNIENGTGLTDEGVRSL